MYRLFGMQVKVDSSRLRCNVQFSTDGSDPTSLYGIDKADIAVLLDEIRAMADELETVYKHMDYQHV